MMPSKCRNNYLLWEGRIGLGYNKKKRLDYLTRPDRCQEADWG